MLCVPCPDPAPTRTLMGSGSEAPLTCLSTLTRADQDNYQQLLGALDYSFLCAYAIGMYLRWVCWVCQPWPVTLLSAELSLVRRSALRCAGRATLAPPAGHLPSRLLSGTREKREPACTAVSVRT